MQFEQPLKKAKLIKRYKRFLADVVLEDDSETTMHVANTGAMTGCAEPNDWVWYSTSPNPKRKYPFSWELTQTQAGHFICVNTIRANTIAEEGINAGVISELSDYQTLTREVKYGEENSKIDVLLSDNNKVDCFVEVKSVTLYRGDGQGAFPDAVTTRGQKHLRELMSIKAAGNRAVLLFVVLHSGIESVSCAGDIDPKYAQLLEQAIESGVEVLVYGCTISNHGLVLDKQLPFTIE